MIFGLVNENTFTKRFTSDNNMMVRVYNETLNYWKTKDKKYISMI